MKDSTLIYGIHPVVDAIKSGQQLEKVILQQGLRGEVEMEIRKLTKEFDIPLSVAPKEKLNKIMSGNHQGVMAYLSLVTYYRIEDVLPGIYERSETPLILVLDGVTDVRNFGAIARSAEICGCHAIVIPQKGGAFINADAMKASAGALNTLPICREKSLTGAIDLLEQSGVQLYASDLQAKKKVFELDYKIPCAIIMGSEGEGVNQAYLRRVKDSFVIPQVGSTDSFNVSVATGIILYEAMKQRL
jgi:23S rRNA (guanosine2251-2'-O)-methyltransferase